VLSHSFAVTRVCDTHLRAIIVTNGREIAKIVGLSQNTAGRVILVARRFSGRTTTACI